MSNPWAALGLVGGKLLVDCFSAAVLKRMPDGTVNELIIETDNDMDVCRQVRDEHILQDDEICVYVKE
jgi:hypothetical protein